MLYPLSYEGEGGGCRILGKERCSLARLVARVGLGPLEAQIQEPCHLAVRLRGDRVVSLEVFTDVGDRRTIDVSTRWADDRRGGLRGCRDNRPAISKDGRLDETVSGQPDRNVQ